jgi:hypothetical protein
MVGCGLFPAECDEKRHIAFPCIGWQGVQVWLENCYLKQ